MRFVPMYLAADCSAIRKPDARDTLALAPAARTVNLLEPFEFPDSPSRGDRLDLGNLAKHLDSQLS